MDTNPLCDFNAVWNGHRGKLLFPIPNRRPYYISAPRWTYSSAGTRALHLLCHALNRAGEEAYVINHPFGEHRSPWSSPELMTPTLDKKRAKQHFSEGRTPIVVYPEVISGNPFEAPVVARWALNYPGLLGGDTVYSREELLFGYSLELAEAVGCPDQVLHIPTIDTRIFYPPPGAVVRKGGCYFASKYKGPLSPITADCFPITRFQPDSMKPHEIAELLRHSEVFYTYENTALAIESVLCGCPAVFLPNAHLSHPIGRQELGRDGYAWGLEELDYARKSVTQGIVNYLNTYSIFWNQLDKFITKTQDRANTIPYLNIVNIPFDQCPLFENWPSPLARTGRALCRISRRAWLHPKR